MAALTRTITQLEADLRYLADIEGQTDRHTSANCEHLINQGWRALRELVNDCGGGDDLTTSSGSCTASQAHITRPDDLVWLYGIDITVGGVVHSLQPLNLLERNEFETGDANDEGAPAAFSMHEALKIHLYPIPDSTYAYTLHYLAYEAEKTGAHTVDTIHSWQEFAITWAALRVLTRDDDDEQFQKVFALHQQNEARVKKAAGRRQRVGPLRRLDTRGIRRRNVQLSKSIYRP